MKTPQQKRRAVILFNLGGPDRPESIAPFLKNFFMDPNIIGAPLPIRWLLSRWIAFKRSRGVAGSSYAQLGGRSPLLDNTRAQANALQDHLRRRSPDVETRVFVCMRYWHPMADEVAAEVKTFAPDEVVLLPLYPQFSTTTTGSSFQDWTRACNKIGLTAPEAALCCYPAQSGFIAASVDNIRAALTQLPASNTPPRLLFSAHGLPEKIIQGGDPYQSHCERTAREIAAALAMPELDWSLCYQSRVGPLKWIGPSTEEELHRAGKDGVPVVIYPLAFVSEHVETLVEIEQEYRHLAHESGVPSFIRVPTVSTHPLFITGLADLVIARSGRSDVSPALGKPCEENGQWRKCPCADPEKYLRVLPATR